MRVSSLARSSGTPHATWKPVLWWKVRDMATCTTTRALSEVYGALTWEGVRPPYDPETAVEADRALVEPPSAIRVLAEDLAALLLALELAVAHHLTAHRVHDARHAATALLAGVRSVYTYDFRDWRIFEEDGLIIAGPPSVLASLRVL